LVLLAVAVVALAIAVVVASRERPLMLAIGFTLPLAALLASAGGAAKALAAEAGTTDPEVDSAPPADSPQERHESVLGHRSRKAGVDSGWAMGGSDRHAVECSPTASQGLGRSRQVVEAFPSSAERIERALRAFGADDDGSL